MKTNDGINKANEGRGEKDQKEEQWTEEGETKSVDDEENRTEAWRKVSQGYGKRCTQAWLPRDSSSAPSKRIKSECEKSEAT